MNPDVKSGSASMPSSSYCNGFSNNGALKKFPPEEKETEGVFLKKQKPKQNHALLAQQVMSLKPALGCNCRVLPTSLFAPVLLAQAAMSSGNSGRGCRSGDQRRRHSNSSGCAFARRKHRVLLWGS